MQIYPAGETITRRLLDLPNQPAEWIITGAVADEIIAAGFECVRGDETRFIHPESGDSYQLARHQYFDDKSGYLRYQCNHGVTLENELATRALTILAMASDGDEIIDPYDGQDDLVNGVLRHVTPYYAQQPRYILITAVWAALLAGWGFRVAHETYRLMRQMVASGAIGAIPEDAIGDAVLQAVASQRPSEFFRVLQRCGALAMVSRELDAHFEQGNQAQPSHARGDLPQLMQSLDQAVQQSDNISSIMKTFYRLLGDDAERVFAALGLGGLFTERET